MRLAMVTHKVARQDGQGRVNYEIARAALERGHAVTVVAEACAEEIAEHPRGRFVPVVGRRLPTQMARNLWFAARSARWLREHRGDFDLVQANGFVTWERADVVAVHFVHSAWLRSALFPFHWGSLSPYAWYQRAITEMNGYFERKVFAEATALVAVSRFTAGEVMGLGVPAEKMTVVPNGVDVGEFFPGEVVRESFGLPVGVAMMLFVGDIRTSRKNLDAVLKAMTLLPEVHLAVAGGVEGSPYPALARELEVGERVHFLGKTQRIAELMRSAEVFVFPSRYEAHPLVLMEALASGLPVVVSENFGAGDYVGAGGIVYGDAEDVPGLVAAVARVLGDAGLRGEMGRAAREIAVGMQWERMAEGYLAVYERVLADRS